MSIHRPLKRIVYAGAYGIENVGDDLPLLVFRDRIEQLMPEFSFQHTAITRHPSCWEQERYMVRQIKNPEYATREEAAGRWFRGFNPGDDTAGWRRIEAAIKRSDLLVLGAGNFMLDLGVDLFRGALPLFASYLFLAKLHRVPVMLYGMSAGPLKTRWGRNLVRYLVRESDVVTTRDELSRSLLLQLEPQARVRAFVDSTLYAPPLTSREVEAVRERFGLGGRRYIAVGLRDLRRLHAKSSVERLESELALAMRQLSPEFRFLFIPHSTYQADDDVAYTRTFVLRHALEGCSELIEQRLDPREVVALYATCERAISVRLHSAVFTHLAGRRGVAIDYLPKVAGYMQSIGRSDYALSVEGCTAAQIVERLGALAAEGIEVETPDRAAQGDNYFSLAAELLRRNEPRSARTRR